MGKKTVWTDDQLKIVGAIASSAESIRLALKRKNLQWKKACALHQTQFSSLGVEVSYLRKVWGKRKPYLDGVCCEPGCLKKVSGTNYLCPAHSKAAVERDRDFRKVHGRNWVPDGRKRV